MRNFNPTLFDEAMGAAAMKVPCPLLIPNS